MATIDLRHGDCRTVMAAMDAESVDAIVTDPPYGLEFMGKEWDRLDNDGAGPKAGFSKSLPLTGSGNPCNRLQSPSFLGGGQSTCGNCGGDKYRGDESGGRRRCRCDAPSFPNVGAIRGGLIQSWHESWAREAYRVLKPGGHLLAFGGSRTYHRLACAIEDAGFEIRDQLQWLYGCLSDDTEILIDGRWEPYHNATVGKHALCYNSSNNSYEWQPIQETFRYVISDTAYRIRGDATDQLVSRNHRCLVERGGSYVFALAETLACQPEVRVPVLEGLSDLLRALPLPHQGTGNSQEDLFERVSIGAFATTATAQADDRATRHGRDALRNVRRVGLEEPSVGQAHKAGVLLSAVQRQRASEESRQILSQRQGQETTRQRASGGAQPSVEGWRYLFPQARELQAHQVRTVPSGVPGDGPQGWLRDGTSPHRGDDSGTTALAMRSRASQGPRSTEQCAGQPTTVRQQSGAQAVRASRYTRADLVHVTPVHYEGVVWCVRVPTGAFVVRRNGQVFVTGNSGFPKSLDVSKAMDKRRQDDVRPVCRFLRNAIDAHPTEAVKTIAERFGFHPRMVEHWAARDTDSQPSCPTWDQWLALKDLLGFGDEMDAEVWRLNGRKGTPGEAWYEREVTGTVDEWRNRSNFEITSADGLRRDAPATDLARQWDGWGSALKPSHEPIVLARKPLIGTIAANVTAHGTGALNVDGCRIGGESISSHRSFNRTGGNDGWKRPHNTAGTAPVYKESLGRWPANVILGHAPECREVGVKRVKRPRDGHALPGPFKRGMFVPNESPHRHKDADGSEVVPDWECAPDCAVAMLDAQSGVRKSGGGVKGINGPYRSERTWHTSATPGQDKSFTPNTGSASRFFLNVAPDASGNWAHDDKTHILDMWERPDRSPNDLTDTTSHARDTFAAASTVARDLPTSGPGSNLTDPSRQGSRFTTSTATSKTTTSQTCSCSQVRTTSDCTQGVNIETACGGSHVAYVTSSNPLTPTTGISALVDIRSTDGVARATSPESLPINSGDVLRFAYVPKASRRERNLGLDTPSTHPTVKPLSLMKWLLTLVVPPGGTVLDPFLGSGTTACAAVLLGFSCIGIEQDEGYLAIAERRIAHWQREADNANDLGPLFARAAD